jgi:Cu(I)/Ag(I) efflux system membrane fusion protein
MHPKVVRTSLDPDGSVPKCPICGMPLSERTKGQSEPLPEGVAARVQLSPERIQLAGIQTVVVGRRPLGREVATVGTVTVDESRLSRVVSRVNGYIEKLYVDKTFAKVAKGDPLAAVYSPDLYSTAQEMLLSSRGTVAKDLAASAGRRLRLWGVSDEEIGEILAKGEASPRLMIRSPQQGDVLRKNVEVGARVEEGMTLLEIADLSEVWIEADVYEKDISLVKEGQAIEATVEPLPDRVITGKVAAVYPQLDAATRTTRVRFQVHNPDGQLRPGMFATVRIKENVEERLAVPEQSVIDTGAKQVVYVERRPGVFDGVEVSLGPRSGEFYPVVKGLREGDRVAAAGAFLIDAETRLNPAAAATYFGASGGPQGGHAGTNGGTHGGQARPLEKFPAGALENINKLPEADRPLARAQHSCPITGAVLGTMGVPVKIQIKGHPVFLCCAGCVDEARSKPDETLKKVEDIKRHD